MIRGLVRQKATDRGQVSLLPESLDDWVDKSNPVRVIDVFVEALDLEGLGFGQVEPAGSVGVRTGLMADSLDPADTCQV